MALRYRPVSTDHICVAEARAKETAMIRTVHPVVIALSIATTLLAATAGVVAAQAVEMASAPSTSPGTEQPYAGFQERAIRALSPERIADLLAGRGAGYALAAELNHYPGPTHVLELVDVLELTPAQKSATEGIGAPMQASPSPRSCPNSPAASPRSRCRLAAS